MERRIAERIREDTGEEFLLMRHGDPTLGMLDGEQMAQFSYRLTDDAASCKRELSNKVDAGLASL